MKKVKTNIVLSPNKRNIVREVSLAGIETWVVDRDGALTVIVDDDFVVNDSEIQSFLDGKEMKEKKKDRIKNKKDKDITLEEVVSVLREAGVI